MLAVVAMFVLMASLVVPNLAWDSRRELRREAELIASQLELARQRSVVTGVPHRMLIDLDEGRYRLEWQGEPDEEEEEPPPLSAAGALEGDVARVALSPPPEELRDFVPLPSRFGRFTALPEALFFVGIETDAGWAERGEAVIDFDRDGTTVYTTIVLEGDEGQTVRLEVLPLADAVRVEDAA